jgi:serine/threonine protein kinase
MRDDPIGETIAARYQILEKVGRGGMGAVYKALDTRLQRIVALKIFISEDPQSEEDFAQTRVLAKILQSLHHPNILQTFDVGKAEGRAYFVIEYVEGRSLAEMLVQARSIHLSDAVEIIVQVGRALEYAHQNGLVHRDVKPNNILVSTEGRVLLSDFGLATAPGAPTLSETGTIAGTPAYMSPEQAMGGPIDGRSDIFSLGTLLYEMLTGVRPFTGASPDELLRLIVEQTPVSPERRNPFLPGPLVDVVMKALAKDPNQRFQTAAAFLIALEGAALSVELVGREDPTLEEKPMESARSVDVETELALKRYEPLRVPEKAPHYPGAIAWLLVLTPEGHTPDERPREFRLADSVTIGRHTDNDLVFFDYEVWHHHARISRENGQYYISDLNSSRGTFVNGVRVEKCGLHDRDQIGIGERTLLFIQAATPKDLSVEAQGRLQEFDNVWDQLTRSARHD